MLRKPLKNVFGVDQVSPIRFSNRFQQSGLLFAAQGESAFIGNQHCNDRPLSQGLTFHYDLSVDDLALCNAHDQIVPPGLEKRRAVRFRRRAAFRPPNSYSPATSPEESLRPRAQ